MIVLGIDPGLANTGFGVIAQRAGRVVALDGGVVETSSTDPVEKRLAALHDALADVFAEHAIEAVALENLYFGQNASSALAVGQARGVALLLAGQRSVPTGSYTPQQVKQAVCGTGRADKQQVGVMVKALLSLPDDPLPDHATDALAVAICHVNHAPVLSALAATR